MLTAGAVALSEDDGIRPDRLGAVIWFTGLPGCGKSTLAMAVMEELRRRGADPVLLQMDVCRTKYCPNPCYSTEERRDAYRLFAEDAAGLARQGRIVLMDGSGNELAMRVYARGLVERFAEVYLRCPVGVAMSREASRPEGMVMAGLYAKAMKRKVTGEQFEGLGEVIGVDVPFEEDERAELTLEADKASRTEMLDAVISRFAAWLTRE